MSPTNPQQPAQMRTPTLLEALSFALVAVGSFLNTLTPIMRMCFSTYMESKNANREMVANERKDDMGKDKPPQAARPSNP